MSKLSMEFDNPRGPRPNIIFDLDDIYDISVYVFHFTPIVGDIVSR